MMNKLSLGLLALSLYACQNQQAAEEKTALHYELSEMELGPQRVYVALITDFSAENAECGYAVSLRQGEKVWLDTLYLDLPAGDTVASEVIFAEAPVQDQMPAHLTVDRFEL